MFIYFLIAVVVICAFVYVARNLNQMLVTKKFDRVMGNRLPRHDGSRRIEPMFLDHKPVQVGVTNIVRGQLVGGKHRLMVKLDKGTRVPFKIMGQVRRNGSARIRPFGTGGKAIERPRIELVSSLN